ncbi:hypothetical protein F4809DRAFT_623398 [Biscogniauxia mediterranea]|nr:hypothetical protein F4809DRAFT_623398 [Biscogniauxia mediterranea]
MPIGDLLAEISGGQSSPAPPTKAPSSSSSGVKRKAEDDVNSVTSTKLAKARQSDGSYSSSKAARNAQGDVDRPGPISRPAKPAPPRNVTSAKPSDVPQRTSSPATNGRPYQPPAPSNPRVPPSNGRPTSGPALQKQSSDLASRPKLSSSSLGASKVPPAKPSPTTPTTSDPSRAPKKGSFAEIMARGAKAQQTMGKVGMIQHKSIEKGAAKKERDVVKSEQKPGIKGKTGKPYLGNGRPPTTSARDTARPGGSVRDAPRNGPGKDVKAGGKQRPGSSGGDSQEKEKKVKKSATATTGYTGTARPRPGATSSKASSSKKEQRPRPSRAGGILAPPRAGRRDRYEDEYDEELDDFIEYDDDEDEGDPRGRGYGYDSDASSDMEAGMSDIDDEERAAERLAREEDKREQALEEKLRREKEERKRRWQQGR